MMNFQFRDSLYAYCEKRMSFHEYAYSQKRKKIHFVYNKEKSILFASHLMFKSFKF